MPKKPAQTRLIIILGGIFFFGVMIYITYQQMRHEYEVCLTFNGGTHCATARGATPEEAIHSAHDIDCGMLANGRDENIVCGGTEPTSVREGKGRQPFPRPAVSNQKEKFGQANAAVG